jgi:hypothetical protein
LRNGLFGKISSLAGASGSDCEHTISREATLVEGQNAKATEVHGFDAIESENEAEPNRNLYRGDICDHNEANGNACHVPEWLHVVLLDGKYNKRQVAIKINGLCCDYAVFVKLNEVYRKYRPRWRALVSLKMVRLAKVSRLPFKRTSAWPN